MILEDLALPEDLISTHWFNGKGWEERRENDKVRIIDIDNLDHYRHILDAYNEAYAKIPESQLPVRNSDLIDFVEETLIDIDIMRASDEWEDFKVATNRA